MNRPMKDAAHMDDSPSMQPAPARPGWVVPAVVAGGVALLALIVAVVFVGGGDDGDDVSTPAGTATSVADPEGTTESTTPGTADSPDGSPEPDGGDSLTVADADVLTIEQNSTYFPWLYPLPDVSWFTEGCPTPETVAIEFVDAITDGPALADDAIVRQSESPGRLELLVELPDGDGGSTGTIIATMARVTVGGLECEAWGVLEVQAPDEVTLEAPTNDDSVGLSAFVAGTGRGREAGIAMELVDQRFEVVGATAGLAGADLAPFGGEVVFEERPIDDNVMVIARSSLPLDNAIAPFAAVKVRFDPLSSVVDPGQPTSGDPDLPRVLGPVAVVGVAFDDVLNARSGGGVEYDIVGTISPFEIGIMQYDALVSLVGAETWVPVGDPASRDLDAWVNDGFVRFVEGDEVQPDSFYRSLTLHREALSLVDAEGLSDLVGDGTVTISTDAFFSGDEQVVTSADLAGAADDDAVRTWGAQDGTGDPIDLTVFEMLDMIASSKGLTSTERVAVNERIKFGNTIDNMADAFPDATIVELHYGGDEGDQADFTWATVRLGFEPDGNG